MIKINNIEKFLDYITSGIEVEDDYYCNIKCKCLEINEEQKYHCCFENYKIDNMNKFENPTRCIFCKTFFSKG